MPLTKFPARLHVLLASKSPRAVILRRGPANAVCSILWDRSNDRFSIGQWLRGRIYERRSDLSPDGKYMIYFARGGGVKSHNTFAWTAISRTPWLRAISLYANSGCWFGGGLFLSSKKYWLNGGCMHSTLEQSKEVAEVPDFVPQGGRGGKCLSVYYPRLLRDGWTLTTKLSEVGFMRRVRKTSGRRLDSAQTRARASGPGAGKERLLGRTRIGKCQARFAAATNQVGVGGTRRGFRRVGGSGLPLSGGREAQAARRSCLAI
jgi:hypothetical protein